MNINPHVQQKLEDYKKAQALVDAGVFDDIQFFIALFEARRLPPEENLAKGLTRGRRKYFLIRR